MTYRHFINGMLYKEISDGVAITENLGKTPEQLTAQILAIRKGSVMPIIQPSKPITAQMQPLPRDQWPMWAKALAKFATPEDKGIGDVAARMIGDEKSAAFKLWFKATFGKDCGCAGRQREWNRKYPL